MDEPVVLDSLPRMIGWLSLLGNRDVTMDGKLLTKTTGRLPVEITGSFFRQFVCVDGCFVCCAVLSVTLDYLVQEGSWRRQAPETQDLFPTRRVVDVNGKQVVFAERDKKRGPKAAARESDGSPYCKFLAPVREAGGLGCMLWDVGSPLGCATAYNMHITDHSNGTVRITKMGMSRKWRYDPAPECEFLTVDKPDVQTNIQLFSRLHEWAIYLDLWPAADRISTIIGSLVDILTEGRVPNRTLVFP